MLVFGQGLRGGCNLNKAEVKGCCWGTAAAPAEAMPGSRLGQGAGAGKGPAGRLRVEVAAQHMHRRWRRRDKSTK